MKVLMSVLIVFVVTSADVSAKCDYEKERADYWNKKLKEKVTERRRERHREAKNEFLACLRDDKNDEQSNSSANSIYFSDSRQSSVYRSSSSYQQKRYPQTMNVQISNYANFDGKKKLAWQRYFKESPQCLYNSGNMKVFVACSKIRKRELKAFNARWNEKTGQVNPVD